MNKVKRTRECLLTPTFTFLGSEVKLTAALLASGLPFGYGSEEILSGFASFGAS